DVWQRATRKVDVAGLDQGVELPALSPLLARRERHRREDAELGNLRPELFFSDGIFDDEWPRWFDELADFERLVEIELLVDVDHPVAFRPNALADLFGRLRNLENSQPGIEHLPHRGRATAATTASSGCSGP